MLFMNYTSRGRAVPMKAAIVKDIEPPKEIKEEMKQVAEEKPLVIPSVDTIKDQLNDRPIILKPKAPRNNIRFVV